MTTTMTNDEIIRMAKEAGAMPSKEPFLNHFLIDKTTLERFTNLVEQRVRSEIALEELAKQAQEQGEYK